MTMAVPGPCDACAARGTSGDQFHLASECTSPHLVRARGRLADRLPCFASECTNPHLAQATTPAPPHVWSYAFATRSPEHGTKKATHYTQSAHWWRQ